MVNLYRKTKDLVYRKELLEQEYSSLLNAKKWKEAKKVHDEIFKVDMKATRRGLL